MNANEQALMDLAARTSAPGYSIDPFLAASALPQNKAPEVQKITGIDAVMERAIAETAAASAGRGDNKVTGPMLFATPVAAPNNASLPGSQDIIQNLGNQLRTAQERFGNDPIKFAEEVAKIESMIAAKKVDFVREAEATAAAQYDLLGMERNLAVNKEKDNAPWFRQKYGMVDSDETIAAQTKLNVMRQAAVGAARASLENNSTYQQLEAYHATFKKLAEGSVASSVERQERLRIEASVEYASYTTEERELLNKAIGNTAQDPTMAFTRIRLLSPDKKKELNAVMTGGRKAVPELALAGNGFAQNVVLANETEVFRSKEVAQKKIADIVKIASSNEEALKTIINMGASKEEIAQATALWGPTAKVTGKAASEDAIRRRQTLAIKYAQLTAQKEFDSDITALNSDLPLPAFLQAAKSDPKLNPTGKIDKNRAIALANQAPTVAERKANIEALVSFYSNAAEKRSQSTFFAVEPLSAEKLKAQAVLSKIGAFWDRPNPAADTVGGLFNEVGLAIGSTLRLPFEYLGSPPEQGLGESMKQSVLKTIGDSTSPALIKIKQQLGE